MWSWAKGEIEIAAPPEVVWDWLVDPDRMGVWTETDVEYLPADRSLLREGYTATEVYVIGPRGLRNEVRHEGKVTFNRYDPPHEMALTVDMRFALSRSSFRVDPTATGTRLRSRTRMRHRRSMMIFGPLVMPAMRKHLRDSLVRLKGLIERGDPRA